jgi:phosphopantetheinyl transferase (holo-ACP synthase)
LYTSLLFFCIFFCCLFCCFYCTLEEETYGGNFFLLSLPSSALHSPLSKRMFMCAVLCTVRMYPPCVWSVCALSSTYSSLLIIIFLFSLHPYFSSCASAAFPVHRSLNTQHLPIFILFYSFCLHGNNARGTLNDRSVNTERMKKIQNTKRTIQRTHVYATRIIKRWAVTHAIKKANNRDRGRYERTNKISVYKRQPSCNQWAHSEQKKYKTQECGYSTCMLTLSVWSRMMRRHSQSTEIHGWDGQVGVKK